MGSELQVNSYTTSGQSRPEVDSTESGEFVVVWMSGGQDGDLASVVARRISQGRGALGDEVIVNAYTTGAQGNPSVASTGGGNFVVTWDDYPGRDGDGQSVHGRVIGPNDLPSGGEFQINSYTTSNQAFPTVAGNASGTFVVNWRSYPDQDGDEMGVFGQRLQTAIFIDGFESGDASAW